LGKDAWTTKAQESVTCNPWYDEVVQQGMLSLPIMHPRLQSKTPRF